MADFSNATFIPKEFPGSMPGRTRRRRTFHIFGFIASTMLIGSLALAGGVYFLTTSAQKNLESAQKTLNEQKSLFKNESIAEVRNFDRRLQAADLLIQNHISPLKLFAALEKATMERVQFTSLSIEHDPTFEVLVQLDGTTPEFKTLALQEVQFSLDSVLQNIVFSQVSTNDGAQANGKSSGSSVAFSLKGTFSPSDILYDGSTPNTARKVTTESLFTSAVLGEHISTE
jgi:hypothetical protein